MREFTLINLSLGSQFGDRRIYERNHAGVFSLIAFLEQHGYRVDFQEHFLHPGLELSEELERFTNLVRDSSPFIGIGCSSVHLPFVVLAAREIRKRFHRKTIILGGMGPTGVAEALLGAFPVIDVVVRGEGEQTLLEILEKEGKDLDQVRGISHGRNGKVHSTPPRSRIRALDAIPLPAYHRMDFTQYEIVSVLSSRGCPYDCAFCSIRAVWGPFVAYRSVEGTLEEMKLLSERFGVGKVWFEDPTFVLKRERTTAFCTGMKNENIPIKWRCYGRINLMDEELMELLKSGGCDHIFYGIETGSDTLVKKVKPGAPAMERAKEVVRLSTRYFETVNIGLMWGFPEETWEDFTETIKFKKFVEEELGCLVQFNWLVPYPLDPVYEKNKDKLFVPEESLMHQANQAYLVAMERLKKVPVNQLTSTGVPSLSTLRGVIASAQMLTCAKDMISQHPHLFPDFYRLTTPSLEKKLALLNKEAILY